MKLKPITETNDRQAGLFAALEDGCAHTRLYHEDKTVTFCKECGAQLELVRGDWKRKS